MPDTISVTNKNIEPIEPIKNKQSAQNLSLFLICFLLILYTDVMLVKVSFTAFLVLLICIPINFVRLVSSRKLVYMYNILIWLAMFAVVCEATQIHRILFMAELMKVAQEIEKIKDKEGQYPTRTQVKDMQILGYSVSYENRPSVYWHPYLEFEVSMDTTESYDLVTHEFFNLRDNM